MNGSDLDSRCFQLLDEGQKKAQFNVIKGVDHFDIVERLAEKDFELTQKMVEMMKK